MTCTDAFKNINIVTRGNQLSISPCCISTTQPAEVVNFNNDPYLEKIRHSFNNGEFPIECNKCKSIEEAGLVSRRQGSEKWYADNGYNNNKVELIRLDYWTGNLCNLRCTICGPHNSSAWREELKLPSIKSTVNRFWKTLDLSTLRFVHFNGGEPLLSKEHVEFLQAIPDKSEVIINYNTNGTVLPSIELSNLWEKFKLVQLDFSIDDIEERFEYQRYPAKWTNVISNLQWYINNSPVNCMFAVNTSIGVLNKHNIDNLANWVKTHFSSNRVGDAIEHRYQHVYGVLSLDNTNIKQITEFLNSCDARRHTNWRKVFPELSQLD
jgi:sulfatase maturation enzyme AslB (radical SAM superfamily)